MRRTPTIALLLFAACALPWANARADRQMDPELRGVVAAAIEPTRCFDDKYEQAVWFATMEPRLTRYVGNDREREQILRTVHCEAKRVNIPPELVLAVMDVESRFDRFAVSSAGAVGLMQLMPATARGLARQMKLQAYDLTDACASIRFGARYIAGLDREFGGNFQYVVAAYNAGSGNVKKWKDKLQGDMDYFTEFTPFIETRYYILRTDKFLTQYGLIYPRVKPAQ